MKLVTVCVVPDGKCWRTYTIRPADKDHSHGPMRTSGSLWYGKDSAIEYARTELIPRTRNRSTRVTLVVVSPK